MLPLLLEPEDLMLPADGVSRRVVDFFDSFDSCPASWLQRQNLVSDESARHEDSSKTNADTYGQENDSSSITRIDEIKVSKLPCYFNVIISIATFVELSNSVSMDTRRSYYDSSLATWCPMLASPSVFISRKCFYWSELVYNRFAFIEL